MNVFIVNVLRPYVRDGVEGLGLELQKRLVAAGHDCDLVRIPFRDGSPAGILSQMFLFRSLAVGGGDRMIALRFPANLVPHGEKILWLASRCRMACGSGEEELRRAMGNAYGESFRDSRKVFVVSAAARERLRRELGYAAEILRPPVNDAEAFSGGGPGGYIFAGGRITPAKRLDLLLRAMALADRRVKLIVAGQPDADADGLALRALAERLGLGERVKFDFRFLPRETYARYVNECAAVAYLPHDEDFPGYVAMEGALAGKGVLTASDSGGALELAADGETGWVAEPNAESLARAMNSVWDGGSRTDRGAAARERWLGFGATWETTLERLLQ